MAVEVAAILSDRDVEGHARLIWQALESSGWLALFSLELVTFHDVGLPHDTSDREVWRFAQANRMILLTYNRNMKGVDSLEQTLRDENRLHSLPILTIGNRDRLTEDAEYRERCADDVADVILYIERHRGRGRIFIPQS